jgi:hypothetical protein
MRNSQKILLGLLTFNLIGCGSAWNTYRPPMADLVGMNASLSSQNLNVGGQVQMQGGKEVKLETKDGAETSVDISKYETDAALDVILGKVSAKLGFSAESVTSLNASDIEVDLLQNWAWVSEGQTFVYGGLRAKNATIETTTDLNLTVGEISYPDIGDLSVKATSNNTYKVTITNPKVYYKIQLAETSQTFPGNKYTVYLIDKSKSVEPIRLNESSFNDKETIKVQPYQSFWNRWFNSYEMPKLSLLIENGSLFARSTRGLHSELIPLDQFKINNVWDRESIFVMDFPVGEFERKLVVLDLKARKEGDDILISQARIRYPEVKLEIKE